MNKAVKRTIIGITTLAAVAILSYSTVYAQTAATPGAKVAQKEANQETRITDAKQRADMEISRRITSLNNLINRINAIKKLSADNKTTLSSQVQTQITNLTTLKSKIDADIDITTLKTDIKSIVDEYRIYALFIPRIHIVTTSDLILQAADQFNSYISILQSKISAAQSAGKDVTSLQASLADMQAKVADAIKQANSAISTVLPLTPGPDPSTYKPTLSSAREMLQSARHDLDAARLDAKTIIQGLKSIGLTKSASSSAIPVK